MSVEGNILNLLAKLKSTKKKDIQDGLKELNSLICQERINSYLNSSSKITWDVLYLRVQDAFSTLIDKSKTGPSKSIDVLLLQTILTKARGKVDTSSFLSRLLMVFDNATQKDIFGSIYLDMLPTVLLYNRKSSRPLKPHQWEDLIQLYINQYQNPPLKYSGLKILEALEKVFKMAASYTLGQNTVTSLLKLLRNIYRSLDCPAATLEWNLLTLTVTILNEFAVDRRHEIAEFTEDIVDSVIGLYSAGKEKNQLIFQILLLALQVHQPQGMDEGHPSCLAINWTRWKGLISHMFSLCGEEIQEILRRRPENLVIPSDFMELLIHLTYIVFKNDNKQTGALLAEDEKICEPIGCRGKRKSVDPPAVSQMSKRLRTTKLTCDIKKLLLEINSTHYWFWLPYVTKTILAHPKIIQEEYCNIVNIVLDMISNPNGFFKEPARLAAALLDVESAFAAELSESQNTQLSSCWITLSSSILRLVKKENLPEIHLLLQSLLHKSKIDDYEAFLNLYLSGLQCDASSVKTLEILIGKGWLAYQPEKRVKLLEWCLSSSSQLHLVDRLITKLCVDMGNDVPERPKSKETYHFTDIFFELSFQKLRKLTSSSEHQVESGRPCLVVVDAMNKFLNAAQLLTEELTQNFSGFSVDAFIKYSGLCITVIRLLAVLNNTVRYYDGLLKLFKDTFFALGTLAQTLVHQHSIVVEMFCRIYKMPLNEDLCVFVRDSDCSNLHFLQKVFQLFESQMEPDFSISENNINDLYENDDDDSFTEILKTVPIGDIFSCEMYNSATNTIQLLLHFIGGTRTLNKYQSILLSRLLNMIKNMDKLAIGLRLQVVVRIIYTFGKLDSLKDQEIASTCLQILSEILELKQSNPEFVSLCMVCVSNMSAARGSAPKEYQKLVDKCFSLIHQSSPTLVIINGLQNLSKIPLNTCDDNRKQTIANVITSFLSHKSIQVRLSAAVGVGQSLFHSDNEEFQKLLLRCVTDELANIDKKSQRDGVVNWTFFVALAYVFVYAAQWRQKAFFLIVQLLYNLPLRNEYLTHYISLVSREAGMRSFSNYVKRHLPSALQIIFLTGHSLQNFPFLIANCNDEEGFLRKYLDIIVSTLLENGHFEYVEKIAEKLMTPMQFIVKNHIGTIIAKYLKKSEQVEKTRMLDKLKTYVPMNEINHVATENTDKTLYDLVKTMDVSKGFSSISIILSEYCNKSSFLPYLAENTPNLLQKGLLMLEGDIEESETIEDMYKSVEVYGVFAVALYEDIKNESIGDVGDVAKAFILRDTLHALLRVVRHRETKLISITSKYLILLLTASLPQLTQEINNLLPSIVTNLLPLAVGIDANEDILNILKLLLVDYATLLQSSIRKLGPLPSVLGIIHTDEDAELSLLDEIANFVNHSETIVWPLGSLRKIFRVLNAQKMDIPYLYEGMQSHEKNSSPLLVKFINRLVTFANHKEEEVKLEALKCLGELGPAKLETLVLRSNSPKALNQLVCPKTLLLQNASKTLTSLLSHENYHVKVAASRALYSVASSEVHSDFRSSELLWPFISTETASWDFSLKEHATLSRQFWLPKCPVSFDVWISDLCCGLLQLVEDNIGIIDSLTEVCKVYPPFAEEFLPLVVDLLLNELPRNVSDQFSDSINHFFLQYLKNPTVIDQKCIYSIVACVDYLRLRKARVQIFSLPLNLDLLLIARAASKCSAHFGSFLLAEIWFKKKKSEILMKNDELFFVTINDLFEMEPEHASVLSEVLRENFASVGLSDGLEGCGSAHLVDPRTRIEHLEHLGRSHLSLIQHDVLRDSVGISKTMFSMGLYHTLCSLPDVSDTHVESATRLSDWSLILKGKPSYSSHKYLALKAYHKGCANSFLNEISNARKTALTQFSSVRLESIRAIYNTLSQLKELNDLEEFSKAVVDGNINFPTAIWTEDPLENYCDFNLLEPILHTRTLIVKEQVNRGNENLVDFLGELYLKSIKLSRKEKKFELALRNIALLSEMGERPSMEIRLKCKIEEACVLWEKGEKNIGMILLSTVLKKLENITDLKELRAKTLRLYGDWMVDTKSENPEHIINKYFKKALQFSNDVDSYVSLAKFADSNYMHLHEYLQSPMFEVRKEIIKKQQHLSFKDSPTMPTATRVALKQTRMQLIIDEAEIKALRQKESSFLSYAMQYYLMALQKNNSHDELVFRLVSLWLENPGIEVQKLINRFIDKVPSYKFLCLLPQLAPRVVDFTNIESLIERCIEDHPHHSLPIVFALKNVLADRQYETDLNRISIDNNTTKRIEIAVKIINSALKKPKLQSYVEQMAQFTEAVIQFAYYTSLKTMRNQSISVPSSQMILNNSWDLVAFPTLTLPVLSSCNYSNVIGVHSFAAEFSMVGGINVPKKINCKGTDGILRPLLIKGKDDLRQDAVMQQVFGVINDLLSRDGETRRRRLLIRTYRVIPLSMRSGIIEWCTDTLTFGDYLTGENGAHIRYHPHELSPREAREKLMKATKLGTSEKRLAFFAVCKKLTPVFHYFFVEKFPSAGDWFEKRLAYIRSVATSSMIGYILGIGDRHPMNILLDTKTGEVIHIDLGIAFEQGKTLMTPEVVPFRLTRDIEDGMGCSGSTGVFRISCEHTMTVLRNNRNTILTLLEVLLYDPLYTWTLTTNKALKMQSEASQDTFSSSYSEEDLQNCRTNCSAERALLQLKTKLMGMEVGGVMTSVEGQVGGLIQQAKDPENLWRHFFGWQAYL